jgi:hypothetical protein
MEDEFLRPLHQTFRPPVDEFGDGLDDTNVLRAQAGFLSFRSGIDHMDGLAGQGGEGNRLPDDGAAAGIARTVDRQHEGSCPVKGRLA